MSVTIADSGTQTTTGSVDTLTTQASAGVYQLVIDLNAMVAGDAIEIVLRTIVLSGGTERDTYRGVYWGVQANPIIYSWPVATDISFSVDIERTAGTDRAYPWSVLRSDG